MILNEVGGMARGAEVSKLLELSPLLLVSCLLLYLLTVDPRILNPGIDDGFMSLNACTAWLKPTFAE